MVKKQSALPSINCPCDLAHIYRCCLVSHGFHFFTCWDPCGCFYKQRNEGVKGSAIRLWLGERMVYRGRWEMGGGPWFRTGPPNLSSSVRSQILIDPLFQEMWKKECSLRVFVCDVMSHFILWISSLKWWWSGTVQRNYNHSTTSMHCHHHCSKSRLYLWWWH